MTRKREEMFDVKTSMAVTGELAVLFVDLVSFTALTEVHGDVAGADAAGALVAIVESHLDGETRLVKTLGDGVLITTPTPLHALQMAASIVEGLHDLDDGFDARAGAHHGPVVERGGDVFGSTVNLASRVSSLAAPGRIVATRPVAESVADLDLAATPLGQQRVRGFVEPVELFEIDPCEHDGHWVTDPVCGMRLPIDKVVASRASATTWEFGFCSLRCTEIFDRAPERFV